jgi:3-hydroxyacyl-[acyl-carrier-protein] dehydratase
MHFDLVDAVIERSGEGGGRIVTVKQVSAAEEYLRDHFPGFPVLPGVMMIEAMVQAARRLVGGERPARLVLGVVRGVKYGRFVKPGEVLRVEVSLVRTGDDGSIEFRGEGTVVRPGGPAGDAGAPTAVSGRFTLRPVRLGRGDAA